MVFDAGITQARKPLLLSDLKISDFFHLHLEVHNSADLMRKNICM